MMIMMMMMTMMVMMMMMMMMVQLFSSLKRVWRLIRGDDDDGPVIQHFETNFSF
jgi:hypothetical protein